MMPMTAAGMTTNTRTVLKTDNLNAPRPRILDDPNVNHGSGERVVPERRVSTPLLTSEGSSRDGHRGAKITFTRRSCPGGSLGGFMRRFVPATVAAFVLGLAVLFLTGSPASAASVFVETTPSTARAGDEIGVRASCTDNLKSATVTSAPLGKVTVAPRYGFLTTTVKVPTTTKIGDYAVSLTCPDGKKATSTLHVVAKVEPSRGPATGGGGTAPGRNSPALIGGGLTAIAAGVALAIATLRRRRLG
jgi:hypothetical protein